MNCELTIDSIHPGPADWIPNNPRFATLVYRQISADPEPASPELIENRLTQRGWKPAWRYGIYDFPHFHSTTHEVVAIYRGRATVRLGHTAGGDFEVAAGDVILIPAGVGHECLKASADFHAVGAYPFGFSPDMITEAPADPGTVNRRIARIARPDCDPIGGRNAPMLERWPD